jgi:signal transduction histidine kinase
LRFWNELLYARVQLSYYTRLSIVSCCFVVCLILQLSALIVAHNFVLNTLFVIPGALAGWLFKWRGASLSLGICTLTLITTNTVFSGGILWPLPLLFAFLLDALMIGIVAFALSAARNGFDLAHTAHYQLEKAQAQMAHAHELQQQLDQLKDQFLLNSSHELRTPLTVVSGYLDLLREQHGQLDALVQKEMIDAAFLSCDELQCMVNKILEVAQVDYEVKEPAMEEIALTDLIHSVLATVDPSSQQEHEVRVLEIPEPCAVRVDRLYTGQIIRNLLSNAFKYTPAHTVVKLHAQWKRQETIDATNALLVFCVEDAGPGIPPEQIPLLFHKFARLQRDLTGSVRGTGLGLYICKQLVERMGGQIWVESSGIVGEGCRFFFTLPGASVS